MKKLFLSIIAAVMIFNTLLAQNSLVAPLRVHLADGTCQQLDSILAYTADGNPGTKRYFSYDDNGYLAKIVTCSPEDGEWLYSNKTEYTYDEQGNLTCLANYYMADSWVGSSKYVWTYDDKGSKTSEVSYVGWGGSFTPMSYLYFANTYDANDRLTSQLKSIMSNGYEYPVVYGQTEYTYDDYGRQVCVIDSTRTHGKMEASSKQEFFYDTHSNMVSDTTYHWAQESGWYLYANEECTYDADGHLTSQENYRATDPWGSTKEEYIYDGNGLMTSSFEYLWEPDIIDGEDKGDFAQWVYYTYYYSEYTPDALELIPQEPSTIPCKVIHDGKIFIKSQGHTYSIGGFSCQ